MFCVFYCIFTQLSNDEALLGEKSWRAANLYRVVPRTRGLDTKRSSISEHGPVKRRSTLLWRVSSFTVQWIFVRRTCSWTESQSKPCRRQFGLRWERSYNRTYKRLNNIPITSTQAKSGFPRNCYSLDSPGLPRQPTKNRRFFETVLRLSPWGDLPAYEKVGDNNLKIWIKGDQSGCGWRLIWPLA